MAENNLSGKRIAFLATDGVEQVELTDPWQAVKDAGATPELVSLKSGKIQGWNHDKKGKKFKVDKLVHETSAEDYDGLVLPGGVMNPDTLRTYDEAVDSSATSSNRKNRSRRFATVHGCSLKLTSWMAAR
jgi:protease I